jgi:hypothetical protein
MSIEMPAALASKAAETGADVSTAASDLTTTALTVLCAAAAILFVSFLAVVMGLA